MYQDWNLIQQDTAAQAKIEEEQRLEREAKERLDAEAALDEDEEPVVETKEEEVLPEDIDIEKLVEEVIVDLAGDELTGWAGRPGSDIEYAKEIRLARLASTEAKEQTAKLRAALG